MQSDSVSELNNVLQAAEQKQQQQKQQEMQQAQEMQQQQIQAKAEEERLKREYETNRDALDRQNDLLVAEIKAAGYGSMSDINQNLESDYKDAMNDIRKSQQYAQQSQIDRQKENNKVSQNIQKNAIEREKIQAQKDIAQTQLQIARENKNRYDKPGSKSKKDKE
tara:strand:- start:371 stop:865 length:495 start_codon:yes stop_codon:yes gene_type:complete